MGFNIGEYLALFFCWRSPHAGHAQRKEPSHSLLEKFFNLFVVEPETPASREREIRQINQELQTIRQEEGESPLAFTARKAALIRRRSRLGG